METVLLLIVGLALAYVIVYTPVGEVFNSSQAFSGHKNQLSNDMKMPEDSTLKRHFLSNLQAEVEGDLSPRPTCSMLRRHFDALVKTEVEQRLAVYAL